MGPSRSIAERFVPNHVLGHMPSPPAWPPATLVSSRLPPLQTRALRRRRPCPVRVDVIVPHVEVAGAASAYHSLLRHRRPGASEACARERPAFSPDSRPSPRIALLSAHIAEPGPLAARQPISEPHARAFRRQHSDKWRQPRMSGSRQLLIGRL